MKRLESYEVQDLVERLGPDEGMNQPRNFFCPIDRGDVGVVIHTIDNGANVRYDILYLIWKDEAGKIDYTVLKNTEETNEFLQVDSTTLEGSDCLRVEFNIHSSRGHKSYNEIMRFVLSEEAPRRIYPAAPACV